jgi:pSer/pThr/pTyr-binding forkhead associated (FHA) protein
MLIRRIRRRVPYLVMADGLEKGKQYILKSQVTRIGAVAQEGGLQNDIVIRDLDHSISRFHCEIHQVKGKLYLLDCNSANGTYINGRRVRSEQPARIGRGSRIGLGRSCSLTLEYRGGKSG